MVPISCYTCTDLYSMSVTLFLEKYWLTFFPSLLFVLTERNEIFSKDNFQQRSEEKINVASCFFAKHDLKNLRDKNKIDILENYNLCILYFKKAIFGDPRKIVFFKAASFFVTNYFSNYFLHSRNLARSFHSFPRFMLLIYFVSCSFL